MILNKIKQNLAGFAAVTLAAAGFTAIAPASAAGTSVTLADVGNSTVTRSAAVLSTNTITVNATVGADERLQNIYFYGSFANGQTPFAIQTGDAIKSQMVYTNLTDSSTASYVGGSYANYNAYTGSTSYNGNSMSVTGSNNTVSRTTALSSLSTGSYISLTLSENYNLTDSSISAGDNLRFVASYWLVRGGVETPLTVLSQMGNDMGSVNFSKVGTVNHTIGASDSAVQSSYNFCIYRGENGVANNTVIEVSIANNGTAGAFSSSWADMYNYTGGSVVPATSTVGNVRTFTMPASGWDVLRVNGSGYLSNLTVGQTLAPQLTAVIQGTTTNIVDTCSRRISGNTAPTVTPAASSIDVTWTAPTHPLSGGTWDSVYVYACETTLNTCGDFPYYSVYGGAPTVPTQSWSFRPTTPLSGSATSATFSASNTMGYISGPNQTPSVWSASGSYEYLVMYRDYDSPFMYVSAQSAPVTTTGGGSSSNVQQVAPTLPTTVPLVAPISVPVGGVVLGGALKIDGRNMASVTSVKIGNVAATTTATIAGLEIKVPTDLAPGAHDLLVTTSTGSTLFVDAIKVADPLIVAAKAIQAKAAASIAYRAPLNLNIGSSVTAAQTKATKALAAQYKGAKNAVCIAVPASKSTVASALAAATKVCATIKAAIPGIKTSVVVTAPSGAKTNRVESEIQG